MEKWALARMKSISAKNSYDWRMAEKMSYNPARVIGIDRGTLLPGAVADITIMDKDKEFVIDRKDFVSKGHNTPFDEKKVKGKVMLTMVGGKIVYKENKI